MKFKYILPIAAASLVVFSGCEDSESTEQFDRMGRAAINTAVSDPFFADAAAHGAIQDGYNSNSDPATWNASYQNQFKGNMAILDSLDTVCGNQFAAGPDGSRYDALSGVLTDDRLYVNTASATCTTYLAVEANATGIIPNGDCGGRTPDYDVVDVSYSVLANDQLSNVGDGIVIPDPNPRSTATFPFLAAPL